VDETVRNRAVSGSEQADQDVRWLELPVAALGGEDEGSLERELGRLSHSESVRASDLSGGRTSVEEFDAGRAQRRSEIAIECIVDRVMVEAARALKTRLTEAVVLRSFVDRLKHGYPSGVSTDAVRWRLSEDHPQVHS
jgi:hypothetical protein